MLLTIISFKIFNFTTTQDNIVLDTLFNNFKGIFDKNYFQSLNNDNSFTDNTEMKSINNIIIFITFSGEENRYFHEYSNINNILNNDSNNSLKNYYNLMSYNKLNIDSYITGVNSEFKIIPYVSSKDISYYKPYSDDNINGYILEEKDKIEYELIKEAFDYVKTTIPSELNLDYNNDKYIDMVTFILPEISEWNEVLWAKQSSIDNSNMFLNDLQLKDYITMPIDEFQIPTIMYHEFGHALGLVDLYEIEFETTTTNNDGVFPYPYSIMYDSYGEFSVLDKINLNWIDNIEEITESGEYTILPRNTSNSKGNIAFKIPIEGSENKFFLVEYIKSNETIYSNINKDRLCISGVDEEITSGNLYGQPYYNYCMMDNENNDLSIIYKDEVDNEFSKFVLSDGRKVEGISIYNVSFNYNDTVTFNVEIENK